MLLMVLHPDSAFPVHITTKFFTAFAHTGTERESFRPLTCQFAGLNCLGTKVHWGIAGQIATTTADAAAAAEHATERVCGAVSDGC